jgi:hypothetical protein
MCFLDSAPDRRPNVGPRAPGGRSASEVIHEENETGDRQEDQR